MVGDIAVLVIDMLNSYQHEDAAKLASSVADIIDPLVGLISMARERDDVDLIYVNDNYGDFTADNDDIVRSALEGERPDLVKPLVPDKVRYSCRRSGTAPSTRPHWPICCASKRRKRLILTGQVTEQCILYTALDAYVRHFPVVVPPDCVAHIDADLGKAALRMMEQNMRAKIVSAEKCLD